MDTRQGPDFSPFAREYARSRPRYPAALFSHLASLAPGRALAWDCATGSGQAAHGLTGHFDRVIATDVSGEQLRHAAPHPRIEYRVAAAERSGLAPASVDLVTVAAAVHWFDLERFNAEVRRVVRPRGVLAAWTYHVAHVEKPFDEILGRFYRDVVGPYFGPGARLVDQRYEALPMPGEPLPAGEFFVSADWTCDQILAFVSTWSGTQAYLRARGEDPLARLAPELARVCGGSERICSLRWPIYLKIARL